MPGRVILLFNPASGRGKAERHADALFVALTGDGWRVDRRLAHGLTADSDFGESIAVIIIGGDGAVHRAAPHVARASIPMLIVPTGTENLLAKELGMRTDIGAIRSALRENAQTLIDMPTVNGAPFLVMCSVGLDAAIVAEVNARRRRHRTGTIRKSSYFKPALRQALRPALPALRITVDDRTVCDGQRGMLVVANCRRYGAGLNPAPAASLSDGLLDIAFYPMRHALDTARWALRSRLGRHETARGFVKARGRVIVVSSAADDDEPDAPVQIDGDPAPSSVALPLRLIADAGKLAVLRPPQQAAG